MSRASTPACIVGGLVGVLLLVTGASASASTSHQVYRDVLKATPPIFQLQHLYIVIPTKVRLQAAETRALKHWGHTRCDRPIVFKYQSYGATLSNVVAEARWSWAGGKSPFLNCQIVFNLDHPTISFAYFCAALTHEYGHLAGFHEKNGLDGGLHSRNPASVMYPVLSRRNIPASCYTP